MRKSQQSLIKTIRGISYRWYDFFELIKLPKAWDEIDKKYKAKGYDVDYDEPSTVENKIFFPHDRFKNEMTLDIYQDQFLAQSVDAEERTYYSLGFNVKEPDTAPIIEFSFVFLTLADAEHYKRNIQSWYQSGSSKITLSGERLFTIMCYIEDSDAYNSPVLKDIFEDYCPLAVSAHSYYHPQEIEQDRKVHKNTVMLRNIPLLLAFENRV